MRQVFKWHICVCVLMIFSLYIYFFFAFVTCFLTNVTQVTDNKSPTQLNFDPFLYSYFQLKSISKFTSPTTLLTHRLFSFLLSLLLLLVLFIIVLSFAIYIYCFSSMFFDLFVNKTL